MGLDSQHPQHVRLPPHTGASPSALSNIDFSLRIGRVREWSCGKEECQRMAAGREPQPGCSACRFIAVCRAPGTVRSGVCSCARGRSAAPLVGASQCARWAWSGWRQLRRLQSQHEQRLRSLQRKGACCRILRIPPACLVPGGQPAAWQGVGVVTGCACSTPPGCCLGSAWSFSTSPTA